MFKKMIISMSFRISGEGGGPQFQAGVSGSAASCPGPQKYAKERLQSP